MTSSAGVDGKGQPRLTACSWNPHHNCSQIATANDTCIRGWDIRTVMVACLIPLSSTGVEGKGQPRLTACSWNPHHNCYGSMFDLSIVDDKFCWCRG